MDNKSTDNCSTVQAFLQNSILTLSQFRSVFFRFSLCSRDIQTSCICMHKGSVNTSFGAEDGLQLLKMVADVTRYEAPAFAKLPVLHVLAVLSKLFKE